RTRRVVRGRRTLADDDESLGTWVGSPTLRGAADLAWAFARPPDRDRGRNDDGGRDDGTRGQTGRARRGDGRRPRERRRNLESVARRGDHSDRLLKPQSIRFKPYRWIGVRTIGCFRATRWGRTAPRQCHRERCGRPRREIGRASSRGRV